MPGNSGTRVEVTTEYDITGRLARFARGGVIECISEPLLHEFASRFTAGSTRAAESIGGLSLITSVPSNRARRNPAAIVVSAGVLVLVAFPRRSRC